MQPSIGRRQRRNTGDTVLDFLTTPFSGADEPIAVPSSELPAIPSTWRPVDGSLGGGRTERFIAYVTGRDLIVTMHSVIGAQPDAPGRLIALITLGGHRVSIAEAGHGRFDARWQRGDRTHCLAAAATTLAGFMSLVLHLTWN